MKQLFACLFIGAVTFLSINYTYAQSCSDTAKKIDYYSPGYKFNIQQHIVSANDTIFLSGKYFGLADSGIYLIKILPDGRITFGRKFPLNILSYTDGVTNLVYFSNGNVLLAMGRPASLGSAGDTTFKLILLNPGGNIIWVKEYKDSNLSSMAIKAVREAPNGDLIVMLNFVNEDVSAIGDLGTTFIRINNSGQILWSNYYTISPNDVFEGVAFSILNDKIYCIGSKRNLLNPSLGYPDYENNLWSAKIDANTGTLIDSKSYLDLRVQTGFYNGTFFNYLFADLKYTNNGQFIYTDKLTSFSTRNGLKKAFIDTNLVFSNAVLFSTGFLRNSSERIIANNKKEVIIYSSNIASGNVLINAAVAKFDSLNNTIRQINIHYPQNIQYSGAGLKPIGIKNKYISLLTNYTIAGDTYLELNQMPDDIELSDCYGSDTSFVKPQGYSITEVNHPYNIITRAIQLQSNDFAVTPSSIPFTTINNCVIKSVCSDLFITGPDSICTTNNTYTFFAHKNGTCSKHVLWQIDTSVVEATQQLNDTTFNIRFKKSWQGYLYGSINSCSILRDSIKINVFKSPEIISLGLDTTICKDSSLILNAGKGFKKYNWQNGSTDSVFTVIQPGKYFVTAFDYCGNSYSDTINVSVNQSQKINLGNDTSICLNKPLTLNAGSSYVKYMWNTGNALQYQIINNAGTYSIIVKNNFGCVAKDTIKILNAFPAPVISLSKNPVLCTNQNNTLNAGGGFSSYTWQDGSTDSVINVIKAGLYKVTVSNSYNCISTDSVQILKIAGAPANFLNADTSICSDKTVTIIPKQFFAEYLWSNGSAGNNIITHPPAIIWLRVKDENNCTGTDTINVLIKDCSTHFYMPNSFTPNNDGKNDVFKPVVTGELDHYELSIYNKYGQLIFYSKNFSDGWNGTIKGTFQDNGVYVWTCRYKFQKTTSVFEKGVVVLIR